MSFYKRISADEERTEPLPTETIQIRIVAVVNKRPDYQDAINGIFECVKREFSELNVEHMNSPIKIFIEIQP